jgi:hypothetical protein
LQLGELLAYAPYDPGDSAWPHRAVRDLLEELRSENIERGIVTEQHSKRGAYWKGMFEGGRQERGLAAQARESAQASQQWPRTAAMLMTISAMWDHQADRADQEAEKDKIRFG